MKFLGMPGILPKDHCYLVTSGLGLFLGSTATRSSMYDLMRKNPGSRMWRYAESERGFAWIEIKVKVAAA